MYLGNNAGDICATYFLPLLPIMENRRSDDDLRKIEELKNLRQIEVLTTGNSCGFPNECNYHFSHGGYIAIYRTLEKNKTCLAIRDIVGTRRDEEGRNIPFNLLFVADGEEDVALLDGCALDVKNNFAEWYSFFSQLFSYDIKANGIKFDLPAVLEKIQNTNSTQSFEHTPGYVDYLMIEGRGYTDIALKEQDLRKEKISCIVDKKANELYGRIRLKETIIEPPVTNNSPEKKVVKVNEIATQEKSTNECQCPSLLQSCHKDIFDRIAKLDEGIKSIAEQLHDLQTQISKEQNTGADDTRISPSDNTDNVKPKSLITIFRLDDICKYKNLLVLLLLITILIILIIK